MLPIFDELIKRTSTKKLIHTLNMIGIINCIGFIETNTTTEVMFKINKESNNIWFTLLKRILLLNAKISINKKFINNNGVIVFIWSIIFFSEEIEKDMDILIEVLSANILLKNSSIEDIQVNNNKVDNKNKDMEIPLYASKNRNKPFNKNGKVSSKGAFPLGPNGNNEWNQILEQTMRPI